MAHRVLIVDDEPLLLRSLARVLEEAGYEVESAASGLAAQEALEASAFDLVLLDHNLPDLSGIEVLRAARALDPDLPVVMITAAASFPGAVQAVKEGAYDYLPKPFELDHVLRVVARAVETRCLREEVARQRARAVDGSGEETVVAASQPMREVTELVRRVAHSEASTILLTGESGVGKGLIARMLHLSGRAHRGPFLNVTCTALSETLLESELFGHEKGAFTDARVMKRGLFELADGGTLFLDEIGDVSPSLQGKLMRFLDEKTFRRVGGTRDIGVTLRVIAATNRDLAREVEAGNFRRDLYFRLKVIPIEIPPLRERSADVPPLAQAFVRRFNAEFRKSVAGFDEQAQRLMLAYAWPGNVRELRNAVERAVLLSEGSILTARDLPSEVRREARTAGAQGCPAPAFLLPSAGVVLEHVERSLVEQALALSSGSRTGAGRLLGLNRDQVRYRIEKFGLNGHASE
jgi:DNA-binding NtrC family response regulator